MIANNKHFSAEWEHLNQKIGLILELAHSETDGLQQRKLERRHDGDHLARWTGSTT